jgi:predicted nucleotidyltransferase
MNTGLNKLTTEKICSVFKKFLQIEKAILYGSRAIGTYKPGSDIDLSLVGKDLSQDVMWKICEALDDLLLPYLFDLSLYETLDKLELKEHISNVGVVFYQRELNS